MRTTTRATQSGRTAAVIRAELDDVEALLQIAAPIDELILLQERRSLRHEEQSLGAEVDMQTLESAFVEVAASYAAAKGIEYSTWREIGVHADVLDAAGISRSTA